MTGHYLLFMIFTHLNLHCATCIVMCTLFGDLCRKHGNTSCVTKKGMTSPCCITWRPFIRHLTCKVRDVTWCSWPLDKCDLAALSRPDRLGDVICFITWFGQLLTDQELSNLCHSTVKTEVAHCIFTWLFQRVTGQIFKGKVPTYIMHLSINQICGSVA